MTIQTINILEAIDEEKKNAERELEKYSEGSSEHMYYKGLLEGFKQAWDIAYASIDI